MEYTYNLSTREVEVKGLGIQGILITKRVRDQLSFHETPILKIKPDGNGINGRRILEVFWLASLAYLISSKLVRKLVSKSYGK